MMKFVREARSPVTIRRLDKGAVTIGDEVFTDNVTLFRDSANHGPDFDSVASLREEQLAGIIAEKPEIIVVGGGWNAPLVPRTLSFAMARHGIGFEVMDTPAACRTFNILLSEGRDAAAVLRITDRDD